MSFLETNLQILKATQLYLYKNIVEKNYELKSDVKVFETPARDNTNFMSIIVDNKQYDLNSRYKPTIEAKKWAEQYSDLKGQANLIIFGMGNLTFLKALRELPNKEMSFIIYEPSMEIFFYVFDNYDLKNIINTRKIKFVVEGLNELELRKYVEDRVKWGNLSVSKTASLPKYREAFYEKYLNFVKNMKEYYNVATTNAHIIKILGKIMVENIIYNMRFLEQSTTTDNFRNLFPENFPAVIVGAGPSLEKNIKLLKDMKNKAFILATDKSLKYLLAEDIIPDATISIDTRFNEEHFLNPKLKDTLFIATTIDSKIMVEQASKHNRIIFLRSAENYTNKFFEIIGEKINEFASGGSVSTTAFSVLKDWGFKNIIFVGQDLSFPDGKCYMDDNDKKIANEDMLHNGLFEVEANDGGTIYTAGDYRMYILWFNNTILINKNTINVINATEGGAKIQGTKVMSLKEAIDDYCKNEINIKEIFEKIPYSFDTEEKREILRKEKENFFRKLKKLKQVIIELCRYTDRYFTLIQRENASIVEMKKVSEKMKKKQIEIEKFEELELILLMAGDTQYEIEKGFYKNYSDKNIERFEVIKKSKIFYEELKLQMDNLEKMIQKIYKV